MLPQPKNTVKQIRLNITTNDGDASNANRTMNIRSLLRGGNFINTNHENPGHKDFWGVTWEKDNRFYDPLPLVTFVPMILEQIQKNHQENNDFDITIKSIPNNPKLIIQPYKKTNNIASY